MYQYLMNQGLPFTNEFILQAEDSFEDKNSSLVYLQGSDFNKEQFSQKELVRVSIVFFL
jgi:hypothetical protein